MGDWPKYCSTSAKVAGDVLGSWSKMNVRKQGKRTSSHTKKKKKKKLQIRYIGCFSILSSNKPLFNRGVGDEYFVLSVAV